MEHEVIGITIDTNLNFYSNLKQLCKKVVIKLYMYWPESSLDKKRANLLYIFFFKGQLSNCLLICTFFFRRSNNPTNSVFYNDYDSSFNEFLEMTNKNTIHIKNIVYSLMTKIYSFLNGLSPLVMSEILKIRLFIQKFINN